VAQACGANPVAVVVPCHRVVMSDGSIGGYSGLPGVKKALLAAEGAVLATASNNSEDHFFLAQTVAVFVESDGT
jgi:alkylated DNA nucleotide flippase Atl1